MHGFMFFLTPEFFGAPIGAHPQKRNSLSARFARRKRATPDETQMDFCLAVTLAIALAINIALTVHYVG